jgi:polar amino acid transport system substrate-binding protein
MHRIRPIAAITACFLAASVATGTAPVKASSPAAPSLAGCKAAHKSMKTLQHGTLQVASYVSPPYTIQKGNAIAGVDGMVMTRIAAMECLTLSATPTSGAALIADIQAKRADIADGGIYYTPQRAQTLSLSRPIYRDGMALLSKSHLSGTLAGLKGKSVGVIQGYLWNADLQKALGTDNVKIYQSSDGMMTDLENGRLDVAVFTTAEAGYRAKQVGGLVVTEFKPTKKVAASLGLNKVVFAMVKGDPSLTAGVNADIVTLIKNGTVARALSANGMNPKLAAHA